MGDGSHDDDKSKRNAHMQRRRDQGLSYRKLGNEFDMSHAHAHRQLKSGGGSSVDKPKKFKAMPMPKPEAVMQPLTKATQISGKASGKKFDNIKTPRGNFKFKNNRPGE